MDTPSENGTGMINHMDHAGALTVNSPLEDYPHTPYSSQNPHSLSLYLKKIHTFVQ
jgi:hypothetical protein